MCGIVASVNCHEWVLKNNLNHRGPDQKFNFKYKNLDVDFYRLSIIGTESDGVQPFTGTKNKFKVWCNGEIFNYKELAQLYSIKLKTSCDIEVIPHLIEKIGISKTLSEIRGFFSMIILDCENDLLYLSIDHFGIKPLYYSLEENKLTISSELRLFKKNNINKLAVKQYFETLSCIAPQTLLNNVYSLEPAQIIKFDISNKINKINKKFYWDIDIDKIGQNSISKEEIKNNLFQAFKRNSLSDYPVSNLLSGGIDSSLIALYNQDGIETNLFFNYADVKKSNYEVKNIDILKSSLKIKTIDLNFNFLDELDNYIDSADEITYDFAGFTYHLLMKEVKKLGYRVVLNGTGGDELFFGYNRYNNINYFKNLAGFIKNKRPLTNSFDFLKKGFWNKYDETKFELDMHSISEFPSQKEYLRYIDFKFYLPNTLLKYVDRISSFHSIESRSPYLDVDLVESVFYSNKLKHKVGEKSFLTDLINKKNSKLSFGNKEGLGMPIDKFINIKILTSKIIPFILTSKMNNQLDFSFVLRYNLDNRIYKWRIMAIYNLCKWYEN